MNGPRFIYIRRNTHHTGDIEDSVLIILDLVFAVIDRNLCQSVPEQNGCDMAYQ